MKKGLIFSLAIFAGATFSQAQVFVLDNFDSGSASGAVNPSTSWSGNVTQNSTTITVGVNAKNDSGWGLSYGSSLQNFSNWNFIAITGQIDAGNATTSISVGFFDDNGDSQAFSVLTSSFQLGTPTTVYIPLVWSTVDPTLIAGWNIGGGAPSPGQNTFRMTFDNLALTLTSTPAVPEPSTYAQIALGLGALGFFAYRRRKVA